MVLLKVDEEQHVMSSFRRELERRRFMPNTSTLKMPQFGENFLVASDRKRLIGIVNNVITPMDPSDIRMLLTNSGTPSNVIDRINYHRGTLNVATEIVTTLEKWGGSPE